MSRCGTRNQWNEEQYLHFVKNFLTHLLLRRECKIVEREEMKLHIRDRIYNKRLSMDFVSEKIRKKARFR